MGDGWRWDLGDNSPRSIAVIEPGEKEPDQTGSRVPFGFARALVPQPVETEPILWEGDDG